MTLNNFYFKNRYFHFLLFTSMLIGFGLLQSCKPAEPVKIGYAGGLTGRVASLGIAGRDGVILAVEEINRAGGINGRPVSLIIKDDKQDAATARLVVKELLSENVAAIIGHMTSSMSSVTVPIINEGKVLMLSPTTSTNSLTGQDDYFFRVYPASATAATRMARHVFESMNISKMVVIYDTGNLSYTESLYIHFKNAYESLGGKIVSAITYKSGPDIQFMQLAEQIITNNPEGLFILANAMDTAMLCQQLSKINSLPPVVTGEWSATQDILEFGGKSVEGIRFYHTFNKNYTGNDFLKFRAAFKKRFGAEAGFAASHAYDATRVIIEALKKNEDTARLKETILNIGTFAGLQGKLVFDSYGDVEKSHFLMTIHDNRFQTLQ